MSSYSAPSGAELTTAKFDVRKIKAGRAPDPKHPVGRYHRGSCRRPAFRPAIMAVVGLSLLLVLGLTSVAQADPRRVVIENDEGGETIGCVKVRNLRAAGFKIEIRGECWSACTLYLYDKTTCVHPEATLRFHSAWTPSPKLAPGIAEENAKSMQQYPPKLRA